MKTKSELNKSGIYKIVNKFNEKLYIGSAVNIRKRWKSHRNRLRKNIHPNKYLQSSFNKYGFDGFDFEILEFVDISVLINREQYWMDHYKSYDRKYGYNMSCIADSPNFGRKASKETKKKLSDSHKGNKQTKETRRKISESQYKPVYQIDVNGNIVNEFNSCKEAEEKTKIWHQSISMCCRGIIKYAKGYQWCYKDKIQFFISKLPKGCKPIGQFINDQMILKWNSITEAVKKTGIPRITICRKLKHGVEYRYV